MNHCAHVAVYYTTRYFKAIDATGNVSKLVGTKLWLAARRYTVLTITNNCDTPLPHETRSQTVHIHKMLTQNYGEIRDDP